MEKLRNIIKNRIIVVLIILAILGTAVLLILPKSKPKEETPNTNLYKIVENQTETGFTVVDFFPNLTKIETPNNKFSFRITFSEPVDENSLNIKVEPDVAIQVMKDKNNEYQIWVTPNDGWVFNTKYKLTIVGADSTSGNKIEKPYTHEFFIEKGKVPNVY